MDIQTLIRNRFFWRSYERVLKHACARLQPTRILEWGPGLSTEIMLAAAPAAKILSIEHDEKYFAAAQQRFTTAIQTGRLELVHRPLSMRGGKSKSYAAYPLEDHITLQPGNGYDLVFVDGRRRADCLVCASLLTHRRSAVILHDSHRQNYRESADIVYPHARHYDDLRTAVYSRSPLDWLHDFDPAAPNTVYSDDETMAELRRRLLGGQPVCYLRFGDCDLYMVGKPDFPGNKRHDATPELRRELAEAFCFRAPDYLVGCVAGGKTFKKSKEPELQAISQMFHRGETYYSAVAVHTLLVRDPAAWVEWIRDTLHRPRANTHRPPRVLLIGGAAVCRHPDVRRVLNVTATIETTDRNAYEHIDELHQRARRNIDKFDTIILALGQAGRVLGWRLWRDGCRTQVFDIGSSIDLLADRVLRSWIQRHYARRAEVLACFDGGE